MQSAWHRKWRSRASTHVPNANMRRPSVNRQENHRAGRNMDMPKRSLQSASRSENPISSEKRLRFMFWSSQLPPCAYLNTR